MVTALDDVVGNITKTLKDIGVYQNTIIIFTSDNGGAEKSDKRGNKPLKGIIQKKSSRLTTNVVKKMFGTQFKIYNYRL